MGEEGQVGVEGLLQEAWMLQPWMEVGEVGQVGEWLLLPMFEAIASLSPALCSPLPSPSSPPEAPDPLPRVRPQQLAHTPEAPRAVAW